MQQKAKWITMCRLLKMHNNRTKGTRVTGNGMENKDYSLVYSFGYPNVKQ